MVSRFSSARPHAVLLALALSVLPSPAADFNMKVTDTGYLDTQGFSVILYQSTYHPTFVDQKNTAMEMILHGQRIATNGDVRLMPTPEQWDLVATLKGRKPDKEKNALTADLSFPTFGMDYTLEVTPEPGGVKVSVNLAKPLPEQLAGRAGFNLEFLPSLYMGKTYSVDNTSFGVMPRVPRDPMIKVMPIPGEPKKLYYQEDWDKAKGYTQPLPFAEGKSITLGVDDARSRITVKSDTGNVAMYDGRNRAQNGWFVLRTMIPTGKTAGAIVWHIRPDVIPNWTRPPMIAHSQVGYAPDFKKVAVIELDPKFNAPKTAKLLRLNDDGTFKQALEGPISAAEPFTRYVYSKFDFSSVKAPGLYVIEYAGQRTAPFPIAKDVYSKTWQNSLSGHLAVQMDHMSVREGYRIWHGASHLDDARQAPVSENHFDGWRQGATTDTSFKPGDHIEGLNVGGWYDAGDFDIQEGSQFSVIQRLALAYREFNLKYDDLSVDWDAREVEMHRPDGIPDAQQQVKQGVLQILAQIKTLGHPIPGINEPNLRQYTHLGDGSTKTDGRIYDPKLGPNEVKGDYSGKPDDRWAFTNKSANNQWGAAASLAAAAGVLKGFDDKLAKECLDAAEKIYKDEKANPTPGGGRGGFGGPPPAPAAPGTPGAAAAQITPAGQAAPGAPGAPATPPAGFGGAGGRGGQGAQDWNASLELLIATNGAEPYKSRVKELFPSMLQQMTGRNYNVVFALPYLDASAKAQAREAVQKYMAGIDKEMDATPFGVPPSRGTWGGSGSVVDFGIRMYFLHKAFPDLVSPEYTLRAVNYIVGTHPVSSTSYVTALGTQSKMTMYGNNRADNTFIPGAVIPGYVIIRPDFPECIEDFGFLWFEHEAVVADSAAWVIVGNAADALVKK
ncbi:MAG: glycoside hydrolase family 9 protein [Candidatus Solibacter sp.]